MNKENMKPKKSATRLERAKTTFHHFAEAMNALKPEQREVVGNALSARRAQFPTRIKEEDL